MHEGTAAYLALNGSSAFAQYCARWYNCTVFKLLIAQKFVRRSFWRWWGNSEYVAACCIIHGKFVGIMYFERGLSFARHEYAYSDLYNKIPGAEHRAFLRGSFAAKTYPKCGKMQLAVESPTPPLGFEDGRDAVSYTHLTLPTIYSV